MSQPAQSGGMTYKDAGVVYDVMDPFKLKCQFRAAKTARNAVRLGVKFLDWTRGESVQAFELPGGYVGGMVEEGLGTKNLIADAMAKITGKSYYRQIAQDTIAMIVNDMATLGILPVATAMHLAVGSSDWFKDEERTTALVEGWGNTCDLARCVWAGGETPTLKDVIYPEAAVLSGSAFGVQHPEALLSPANVQVGDAIILLRSSGVHANGLTLCRKIAEGLPAGYQAELSDGRMYGEALLDPTHIYSAFVEDCLVHGMKVKYAVNITGHGWRKLMRAPQPLAYVIHTLPPQLPIFKFIQNCGKVSDREMYGNFNMGAGFALFVPQSDLHKLAELYHHYDAPRPFDALIAGQVEESAVKKVVIEPAKLEFLGETLQVRK